MKAGCREELGAELRAGAEAEGLKPGLQLGPISMRDTDWRAKQAKLCFSEGLSALKNTLQLSCRRSFREH